MEDTSGTAPETGATRAPRADTVWEALRAALDRLERAFPGPLEVVDVGGGTGGTAVPVAGLGHRVTVIDPNPDSLAALERRAAESGVVVRALQGETGDLTTLLDPGTAHLVLMHNVVEFVPDPRAALADVARLPCPGGMLSLLVSNSVAAALHRAVAGHLDEARQLLASGEGRWGEHDPMPRRFTGEQAVELVAGTSGFDVVDTCGVRVFADLLPGRVFDDPHAARALAELELAAARHPALAGIATQTHVLAERR